jgi:hypothetical protein
VKKLKLALEHLAVESFPSTEVPDSRGTVEGNGTYYAGCQYTTDRYDIGCHSGGDVQCAPTQYYMLTCDITSRRMCCQPAEG